MESQIIKSTLLNVSAIAGIALLVAGCTTTRSISNSGYREPGGYSHMRVPESDSAFAYRGELSEFEVLGIQRDLALTEEQIGKALDAAKLVRVPKGSSVLLIQSG